MSPQVAECIEAAVQLHVSHGGMAAEHMRKLITALCELAESDGKLSGVQYVQAALETESAIRRAAA